ncbi:hypothetical protein GUI12_00685 [Anaplasmataceae bacterium AB001_6]|nr:hypothetical protein GUI12_00685 [Anaplasmataceae bacterium AB001_6]
MIKQLSLIENDIQKSYKIEDYIISKSNRLSHQRLISSPWDSHCAILFGVKGSGKSHLANLWKEKEQAQFISNAEYDRLMTYSCVIEDFDKDINEINLFHCFNIAKEYGNKLLLTSSVHVNQLKLFLPDLKTRFFIAMHVELFPPDDDLLKVMLFKAFHERNIRVDTDIIKYVLDRIDRTAEAVFRLVDIVCDISDRTGHKVNMRLIRSIINDYVV